MKNILQKSTGTMLAFALLLMGIAPTASAMNTTASVADAYPMPQERLGLTIYWGNVDGAVQDTSRMNFDGSVSVDRGMVNLVKTIKFERHDAYRDAITNKQNPVSWRSLIYNQYDGVEVEVNAVKSAKVRISTTQGEMVLPVRTLMRAKDSLRLNFGDGREIIVKVKHYVEPTPTPQTTDVIVAWGGPISKIVKDTIATNKATYTQAERTALANKILKVSDVQNIQTLLPASSKKSVASIKKLAIKPTILPKPIDFSGAVALSGNGKMRLFSPMMFENNDKITRDEKNYTSWKSTIRGHFDAVVLNTSVNDAVLSAVNTPAKLTYKTKAGGGFGMSVNLKELYKKGFEMRYITVGNAQYGVVMVALPRPVCQTLLARLVEKCPSILPAPTPLPAPKPMPMPMPPIKKIKINQFNAQATNEIKPIKGLKKLGLILTRNLHFGSRGADVSKLQRYLKEKGYYYGNIVGYYGPLTRKAVQRYQCVKLGLCSGSEKSNGYGMVGPMTRHKLAE